MHHYRKTHQIYRRLTGEDKASGKCPFCRIDNIKERTVAEKQFYSVIPNRTYYDIFEGLKVEDHLMVVPKRHVESIDDFTQAEKLEAMDIIGEYEKQGYNIYARGMGSLQRSVRHQHTHLIKLNHTRPRFMFYLSWPYMLLHK